jgi:hypothetical protein
MPSMMGQLGRPQTAADVSALVHHVYPCYTRAASMGTDRVFRQSRQCEHARKTSCSGVLVWEAFASSEMKETIVQYQEKT